MWTKEIYQTALTPLSAPERLHCAPPTPLPALTSPFHTCRFLPVQAVCINGEAVGASRKRLRTSVWFQHLTCLTGCLAQAELLFLMAASAAPPLSAFHTGICYPNEGLPSDRVRFSAPLLMCEPDFFFFFP